MKRECLPALIMLTAGAVDCVLSFVQHMQPFDFTKRLLIVLLIFFMLGTVIQWIVNANFPQMEEEAEAADVSEEGVAEGVTEMDLEAADEGLGEELENINAENNVE